MTYKRIRELREERNYTQSFVGKAINVTQRSYSYYENGGRMIPIYVLSAIADFYGVSIDYIVERTDEKTPYPKGKKEK